jgi:mRNA interferase YafQ
MRTTERTTLFRRDFKREAKRPHRGALNVELREIVDALVSDRPLPARYRDHALTGDWKDYRDCHVRPDLVLIYRLIGAGRLILARLGSHSELDL